MPLIIWKDSFLTGFNEIDAQHKNLVVIINTLFDSIADKERQSILDESFKSLVKYTVEHFKVEENLMKQYSYPDKVQHEKEHSMFIAKIGEMSEKFKSGDSKVLVEVLNFLKDWLINHILVSDRKYIQTFTKQGYK